MKNPGVIEFIPGFFNIISANTNLGYNRKKVFLFLTNST